VESEKQKIPPRSEWHKLSVDEIYLVKTDLTSMYFNARSAGATYADQFKQLISYLDAVLSRKLLEQEQRGADE